MPTPSIQTLVTDAQQVLNLDSISAVRSVVAVALANANTGTPLNPSLTTQQLWNEFYQVVTKPKSDIESIIANQLMKFLYAPPAPGGVGANGQVIFNDNGVLAGDPQFLWNKTTNLLTVTGSATITGDLTVKTNVLKVDSTNNRVGIGTASPAYPLSVNGRVSYSGAIGEGADQTVSSSGTTLQFGLGSSWTQQLWYLSGSEVMRLSGGNLGLGVTPSAWNSSYRALQIGATGALWQSASGFTFLSDNVFVNSGASNTYITTAAASFYRQTSGVHSWWNAISGPAGTTIAPTQAMTLDANNNLGLGVVPTNIANVTRFQIQGAISSHIAIQTASTNASARNWMVGANLNAFGDFVIRQGASQGADPNGGTDRLVIDASGNFIPLLTGTAPTLGTNSQMVFNLTSNTNLRISVRGTDGVTRTANITLA